MATVKELHVNGAKRAVDADAERTLLSVLRDDLDLTGCKYGCGEGRCGACTVLIDGQPTRSCNTKIGAVAATWSHGAQTRKPVALIVSADAPGSTSPASCSRMNCGYGLSSLKARMT